MITAPNGFRARTLPPLEHLRKRLAYDPVSGLFTRKRTGNPTGRCDKEMYVKINLQNRDYQAHRIAWFMHHGSEAQGPIDHINGIKSDNRIENLRCVTIAQNTRNRRRQSNTSGVKGVSWAQSHNRWLAQIKFEGVKIHLGRYRTIEGAAAAYKEASQRLHGEFGRIE